MTLEGNPWFSLSDVASILDLGKHVNGGYHQHLRALGEEESQTIRRKDFPSSDLWKPEHINAGRLILISESGLYKLIMRSDKPQAKAFQDWVTKEVLPSIRKTGSYVTGPQMRQHRGCFQPSLVENPQMSALELAEAQMSSMQAIFTALKEQARMQHHQRLQRPPHRFP